MNGELPTLTTEELRGTKTLITGSSNVGKTRLTAAAATAWMASEGPAGVVLMDFAPEIERDDTILGGRLDRFMDVPEQAWYGHIEARAPRFESESDAMALELARANATASAEVLQAAPPAPSAVFVNDATIPYHAPGTSIDALLEYCSQTEAAVMNAFTGTTLGTRDAISQQEAQTIAQLRSWAQRTIALEGNSMD